MLAANSYEVLMASRLFSTIKLLLLSTILIGGTTGSLTWLITGHAAENDNKHSLASLFVHSYDEITKESPADLFVFTNAKTTPSVVQNNRLLSEWSSHELARNLTTLVVANVGIEQMSPAHLDVVQRFITNDSAVVAIEIGSPRIETRMLLERRVSCATRSSAYIASPNVVYFCNNASPKMLSNLRFEKPVYIEPLELMDAMERSQRWLLWPNLFAAAAKIRERTHHEHEEENLDHQHHSHLHHRHHHHPHHGHHDHNRNSDEDVEEMVDKIMEDIVEQGGINTANDPIREQNKVDKKQACKYRKSCYETGIKPVIDDNSIFNFRHWWPEENEAEDEDKEEVKLFNENEDLPLLKLHCKYRRSCYQEHGIPFKEKSEDEERKKPVLAYKTVPLQHGKKKTLKEIAAEALKKVEESTEKAAKRPLVKIVEKQMTAMEEKLSEKLHCKYRKSCYETGEIPYIEENWSLPLPIKIFSTESVDSENNQINFDELEQLEKKLYCKYRKSCYETGVKPDIEPEIFINSLKDLTTIHQQVETRKPSLQEKCKYRKSCYETGIVPDINPKLEAVISKEVSSVIPTNTQDLRLLCKYRKSCYAEVHSSATVETIKLLRKRRQIEKELRRRKAARTKHHRKLRGEIQLGHHRKAAGKKTQDESIDDVKERNIRPLKISDKKTPRKQGVGGQEDVKIKEQLDSESKKGKVKKPKPEIKESDQLLAIKPKETSSVKKERKGKKVKLEKEASTTTPTMGSKEETDVTDFPKKEAKSAIPSPLKTELHVTEEEQDTERASIGDDKKGKRFGKAVQTMNKLIEEMQHQQEQQKRKEFCKYRKSCYETGKRPEIKQSFHNLLEMFKDHVDRETDEVHVIPKTEAEKKLDCKYRRSCYRTGEYSRTHETKEDFKYDTESNDNARIPPKESRFHTEQQTQSDSVNMIGLERYKKSGKCSPYYYSCRGILGLPPKERAPIGPNGRRLCRKKPLSSA